MKRLIFQLLLLTAALPSHAQLSLDGIFAKAKAKLAEMAGRHANRILDEGLDALDAKASKVSIVSSKLKAAAPAGKRPQASTKQTFVTDTASMAPPTEVDSYLSRTFPNFYRAYAAETDSDPLIRQVQFGYREGHRISCSASSRNGSIFFELFYFDTRQSPRAEAVYTYEFYTMQGILHAAQQKPKNGIEKWRMAYEFALGKAKASAEGGYCLPLTVAVNILKSNMAKKQLAPLTRTALDKYNAQKIVYESEVYRQCAAWVAAHQEPCRMPVPPIQKPAK